MQEFIVYDTETTGLPDWRNPSDGEQQPHIVQLAAKLCSAEGEVIDQMNVIVRPEGWEIPEDVIAVHGITAEQAEAEGVPEAEALEQLLTLWDGRLRVGHNQSFDSRIIRIATKRYSDEETIDLWKAGEAECTMQLAKPIMQIPPYGRYGWKAPKLAEAYEHFTGKSMENAHDAMADVDACLAVYLAIKAEEDKAEAAAL